MGLLDGTSPSATPPSADPAPPATPDIRSLIDQSRKMGATDDQIRDLMVKAPFLQDTWQASEKAGIPPDAVFQHFGLSAPAPTTPASDASAPAQNDMNRPITPERIHQDVSTSDPIFGIPARIGRAAAEGYDNTDILTPEGHAAVAKLDKDVPVPILSGAVKAGNAVLGAGNALFSGGVEGIAALGEAAGQPQLGHDVAGYLQTGGAMEGTAHAPEVSARPSAADAVSAIGKAPDIDSAIAAAGKAAAAPGEAAPIQAPTLTDTARMPAAANDEALPPAATPAPEPTSAGAAATSELDPGVGELTPEQELAYRSTAEGQKLLEPQPYGAADNTAYVPGVTHSAVETAQTVESAREMKTLKALEPEVAEEAASIRAANGDARRQHFEQLAGSDVDIANATAARNAQMEADTQNAWEGKTEADISPVVAAASNILQSRAGRRDLVRSTVNSVIRRLYDDDGNPISDPEVLYGVGEHINDLLDKNDPAGKKVNEAARAQLMQLKNALYDDVIEPAAPGFKQALDNYRQASIKIDEMAALQKFEPKLYDANNQMTYAKVQSMMRQIVDSRQAPGINPYKSISPDTMAGLWNLRDDLRRSAAAENLARTPGSDTAQNMLDATRQAAVGVGSTILHAIPLVGDAVKRGMDVAQPLLDARVLSCIEI